MLIPGVDDAPYTLECLGTVLAFSSLIQPVEGPIACVDSLVRRRVSISLNWCEEIVCAVCLGVSSNIEVQPRSEGVDRRR